MEGLTDAGLHRRIATAAVLACAPFLDLCIVSQPLQPCDGCLTAWMIRHIGRFNLLGVCLLGMCPLELS